MGSRRAALVLGVATALAGVTACANRNAPLYPTHIETPDYERVAHLAHIEGKVIVTATIGTDGKVIAVEAAGPPMLAKAASANFRLWKFEAPKESQRRQVMVYDYRIEGAGSCDVLPPKVSFELPGRVEIVSQPWHTCDPAGVIRRKKDR